MKATKALHSATDNDSFTNKQRQEPATAALTMSANEQCQENWYRKELGMFQHFTWGMFKAVFIGVCNGLAIAALANLLGYLFSLVFGATVGLVMTLVALVFGIGLICSADFLETEFNLVDDFVFVVKKLFTSARRVEAPKVVIDTTAVVS